MYAEPKFQSLTSQVADLYVYGENPVGRIRLGLPSLDTLIEGPAGGEVMLLLGRSFTGKTQFMVNMIYNNRGRPGIFFSLEMPVRQVLMRLTAIANNLDHDAVLDQVDHARMSSIFQQLPVQYKGLHIDDESNTISQFEETIDSYVLAYGKRPEWVGIDYLELIAPSHQDYRLDGFQRTEATARGLKQFAKEQDVPLFVIHQTNKGRTAWQTPDQDSARGAGYTEADLVVGISMPGSDPGLSEAERLELDGKINVACIKNRVNGRLTWTDIGVRLERSLRIVDPNAAVVTQPSLDVF
jgi:replicative DNA helicase